MTLSIYPKQVRGDSTILPVIQTDTVDLDTAIVQIDYWQYFNYLNKPLTVIPLNRTQKEVEVVLKNIVFPDKTYSAGVSAGVGNSIQRTSGTGYGGAYTDDAFDTDYLSVSIKATSTNLSVGVSLQDESDTVTHDYNTPTVRHSIILGQNGQGSIRENGSLVANNGLFRYEQDDQVMIELKDGVVRYYLIKSDNTMKELRTTRSKLTENPRIEFLLYFTGSRITNIYIFDGDFESTTYESVGVAYFRNADKKLYWQDWQNQRATQSIGESLEMADKRTQTTYANQKHRLAAYSLTPSAMNLSDFWDFQDFVDWHDAGKEFIFIDYARNDRFGNPLEIWAKFTSPFVDATRNGCQFTQQVSILQDFRNDYIPALIDTTAPEVVITSIEAGSAVVSGTASDNVLITSLQLYINGKKYGNTFLPDESGNFQITVPTEDMTEGVNSFYVIARDYGGNTTQSATETFTVDTTPPSVPTGLSVSMVSSTRIDGSFTPSTDNVGVTHYRLRRATNSGFSTGIVDTDLGTSHTFSATGLSPSTTYYFKVLAEDAQGNQSAYSSSANATTDAPSAVVLEYDLDLQSYTNNQSVTSLTDSSGNSNHATNASNVPKFKTDDGNYLFFDDGGGVVNYLTVPDYTSLLGSEAQIFVVLKAGSSATKLWRMLGESDQAAAHTEIFSGNLYEPFGTTTRKDNKTPSPLLTAGWCVYRVITKNGLYTMQVNGTTFFTTATNTFNKSHTNPFMLGYGSNGSAWKMKYLAVLSNTTTDLTSALRTRFGI